jgi:hypothetical protein
MLLSMIAIGIELRKTFLKLNQDTFGFDMWEFVDVAARHLSGIVLTGYFLFFCSLVWIEKRQKTLKTNWCWLFVLLVIAFQVGLTVFVMRLWFGWGAHFLDDSVSGVEQARAISYLFFFLVPFLSSGLGILLSALCMQRVPTCAITASTKSKPAVIPLSIFFFFDFFACLLCMQVMFAVFGSMPRTMFGISLWNLISLAALPYAVISTIVAVFWLQNFLSKSSTIFIAGLGFICGVLAIAFVLLIGRYSSSGLVTTSIAAFCLTIFSTYLVLHSARHFLKRHLKTAALFQAS